MLGTLFIRIGQLSIALPRALDDLEGVALIVLPGERFVVVATLRSSVPLAGARCCGSSSAFIGLSTPRSSSARWFSSARRSEGGMNRTASSVMRTRVCGAQAYTCETV